MSSRSFVRALLGAALATATIRAQDADSTREHLHAEFAKACDGLARQLWAQPLCGPLVFVDRSTRRAFSNVALAEDGFTPRAGGVYTGRWPDSLTTANTAITWRGLRLSVVGLPLPDDDYSRIALLAHESFHRIQPALGLGARDPVSAHLEESDGRLWLRLEMRALTYALTSAGDERMRHAREAMLFRRYRYSLYPGADTLECALEIQEGLAEYTGQRVALAATGLGALRVVRMMDGHQNDASYSRSFAYATGPALGLLLDVFSPGWRRRVGATRDIGKMLMQALAVTGPLPAVAAIVQRARPYGFDALARFEADRALERVARVHEYRRTLVDGPVLELAQASLNTSYDPLSLFPFAALGTVYPTGIFRAEWGQLQVDSLGALVAPDFRRVRVAAPPAPATGTRISGRGWALQLNEGWVVVPGSRAGDFVARRRDDRASADRITVIAGATVIDMTDRAPVSDAVIVMRGSRIDAVGPRGSVRIPEGATIVDAAGKYITPGLADMHNHLLSGSFRLSQNLGANLGRLLAYGVTTVLDPSISRQAFAEMRQLTAADTAPYPRFFSTGPTITVPGDGMGAGVGAPTPQTEAEARAAVRELQALGVHAIKIVYDDLTWSVSAPGQLMKTEVLAALISEAHAVGLKAYVHAPMFREAKAALVAGADGLLHGVVDKPVDEEFIGLMRRNRAVYVATQSLYEDVADLRSWMLRQAEADVWKVYPASFYESFVTPVALQRWNAMLTNSAFTKEHLATARSNIKRVSDANITVVCGTDAGFFGVALGPSTHLELALLVEAGLTTRDALRAATVNAARMLGREAEFGTVEAGKAADLVIFDANPLDDIRNVAKVHRVVKGGIVRDPVTLLPPR
jgi:imidazolonepropionase-like amidohydrolase